MFVTIWQEGDRRVLQLSEAPIYENAEKNKVVKFCAVRIERDLPVGQFEQILADMKKSLSKS